MLTNWEKLEVLRSVYIKLTEQNPRDQTGICFLIKKYVRDNQTANELICWIHDKYMPNRSLKEYWWPANGLPALLGRSKKRRLDFLLKIIQDLTKMSHLSPSEYKRVLTLEERIKKEQDDNWKEYNRIRNSGPISLYEEKELADEFGLFEEDSLEDSTD